MINLLEPSDFGTIKNVDKNWSSTGSHNSITSNWISLFISIWIVWNSKGDQLFVKGGCSCLILLTKGNLYPLIQSRINLSEVIVDHCLTNSFRRPAILFTFICDSLVCSDTAVWVWMQAVVSTDDCGPTILKVGISSSSPSELSDDMLRGLTSLNYWVKVSYTQVSLVEFLTHYQFLNPILIPWFFQ